FDPKNGYFPTNEGFAEWARRIRVTIEMGPPPPGTLPVPSHHPTAENLMIGGIPLAPTKLRPGEPFAHRGQFSALPQGPTPLALPEPMDAEKTPAMPLAPK